MEKLGQQLVSQVESQVEVCFWAETGFCIFTRLVSYKHPRAPESQAESQAMCKCQAMLPGKEEEEGSLSSLALHYHLM